MARKLSKYMLKRKVAKWGWTAGKKSIIVVFDDGRMAAVDPVEGTYWSIRAWNWYNRSMYLRIAKYKADGTLAELLTQLGYEVIQ